MQNGNRETTGEEIVSSKNMDKFQSKHGMKHQKSVQENNNKKMPLFLKYFNGWHQNVKLNVHFFF